LGEDRSNLLREREMKSTDIDKKLIGKMPEPLRQHDAELEKLKVEYQRKTQAWLQVEEEERKSIAREIHDDLSQPLTALKINLSGLVRRVTQGEEIPSEKLEQILELNNSIIRTVKRISLELRPGVLDDFGLIPAIEWQAGYFRDLTGIECKFEEPSDIMIDGQIASVIFRILQKILANIVKQAEVTRVRISLKKEADKLNLIVVGNGERSLEEQILDREPFELIGEYAHLFGGEVEMGNPNRGTLVMVNIPLNLRRVSL
jgi:two-component system sensor histidine kinase UhpB